MAEIYTYTYNLNLDLSTHPINSITIKQYGKNTYYLNISVTQKGVVYIIDPASYRAYFKMKTPDKRYIYQLCEIDESGRVICELPESAAWASGVGEAEIEVIKNDGTVRMSTCSFEVVIDPSAYPEEEITGSNDFSALVDYVSQAGNMDQQVQEAQEAAETASSAQTAVTEMKTTIEGWKTAMQADKTDTEEAKNTAVEAQASALQSAQSASADAEELSSMLSTAMAMYNGPLTASDVSQMTDHTKVYVFTGTDVAGMNKGDWYYWDNSATAWVSGGQYLAGEITVDDTLTQTGQAADAKKTGDEITSIKSDLTDMQEEIDSFEGISEEVKHALLACFQNVTWETVQGNTAYRSLKAALYGTRLPEEYQEVEYIQSSGTQYINTGILSSLPMRAEIKAMAIDAATPFLGAGVSNDGNSRFFFFGYMGGKIASRFSDDNNGNLSGSWLTNNEQIGVNNVFTGISEIDATGRNYLQTNGGASIERTRKVPTVGYPIKIMIQPNTGTPTPVRIYELKMYKGTTLCFDGVPCYVKATSAGGMYDLVSNTFFGNDGTGSFILGGDV